MLACPRVSHVLSHADCIPSSFCVTAASEDHPQAAATAVGEGEGEGEGEAAAAAAAATGGEAADADNEPSLSVTLVGLVTAAPEPFSALSVHLSLEDVSHVSSTREEASRSAEWGEEFRFPLPDPKSVLKVLAVNTEPDGTQTKLGRSSLQVPGPPFCLPRLTRA